MKIKNLEVMLIISLLENIRVYSEFAQRLQTQKSMCTCVQQAGGVSDDGNPRRDGPFGTAGCRVGEDAGTRRSVKRRPLWPSEGETAVASCVAPPSATSVSCQKGSRSDESVCWDELLLHAALQE